MVSNPRRTMLITGAARRIGRALAMRFAAEGWAVAIHYNTSAAAAAALVDEIRVAGGTAVALDCDLADIGALEQLVARCAAAVGPPDCLVNNASDFAFDSFGGLSEATWARHLTVNLTAPVFLAQAMVAALPDDRTGNVINIIDQRVWNLTPEFFSYTVSKAGLWSATRMLAQALAPRVRVNAIGPGPVLQSVHQTEAEFAAEVAGTLLGRPTPPEEIAAAIRFILDAPAMTGQMIALDAGQHLGWTRNGPPGAGSDVETAGGSRRGVEAAPARLPGTVNKG